MAAPDIEALDKKKKRNETQQRTKDKQAKGLEYSRLGAAGHACKQKGAVAGYKIFSTRFPAVVLFKNWLAVAHESMTLAEAPPGTWGSQVCAAAVMVFSSMTAAR
mgnify:CR=1 FL=1